MNENIKAEKSEKPPIRIKMKVGVIEFEIECQENQIQEMVQKVLSSIYEYANKPLAITTKNDHPITRAETCRGIIERLWKENWFAELRALSDVHEEMMRTGYNYDRTAVAHVLLDLVRDGILTRQGRPRRYVYVQKRPPKIS